MSSTSYSTCLTPDPWLRIVVLTSGRILVAAGLAVILTLELDAVVRGAACIVWVVTGYFEIAGIERGFESCTAIRLWSNGEVAVLNDDREWLTGTLQTGSVLLQNFAWLRVRTVDGEHIVEPLRGNARQSQEWRRLQVIWRHIGADG